MLSKKNVYNFLVYIKILEITRKNCYKCNLETIIDPNDSQYFWVNRKDLEVESDVANWAQTLDKCGSEK